MGKKDKKKKDPEKKAAIAAKKEAKAEKAALKRLKKEAGKEGASELNEEDDFDSILATYSQKKKNDITHPVIETLDNPEHPFPLTRANFSFTYAPTSGEIYLFGGEYYNGVENVVFDELFKFNPDARPNSNGDDNESSAEPQLIRIGEWKQIMSPDPTPPARCAHSAVYYNNCIYIFGGELATAAQFHHYRDFWKFDLSKNTWEEVKHRGNNCPSPRSGHRCIVWRHYMILFGGFYEALKETKWFQDLWVFDFATNTWMEMKYSKLATLPEPRSAFSFGIHPSTDIAYLYGGFSKLKNPGKTDETKVHTDCWALHLKSLTKGLDANKAPTWERLKRKGTYPTPPRSGMGCVVHKQRLLLFGGVNDTEKDGHKFQSIFYDNMYALEMEKKRWFDVGLKKKKDGGRRRKKKGDDGAENDNEDDDNKDNSSEDEDDLVEGEGGVNTGWDLDKLRSNMFAFIDGDGNIVYEKIEDDHDDINQDAKTEQDENNDNKGYEADQEKADGETTERGTESDTVETVAEAMDKLDIAATNNIDASSRTAQEQQQSQADKISNANIPINSSTILKMDDHGKPTAIETPTPLPRINAALAVKNNTLYLYGGLLEVGDREVTLDDCWCIDLQKREEWTCIWRGTMHQQVWKGVDSDLDDASYISTGDDRFDGMEDSDSEGEGEGGDIKKKLTEEEEQALKEAKKAAKKEARKKEKASIRNEISSLREKYDLDDDNRTPQLGEVMADFYSRTSEYWNQQAAAMQAAAAATDNISEQERLSHKEMKREGFLLAKERYEELKPALERLNELEEMQTSAETKKNHKKDKDKSKKSDGKKKDRRH